ncbi:endonuclease/exonuclease/phosphatase family protein [Mesobacterium pallidum]|uniref:endonuclease/exonuclease/phosphatase family protein n=1 Tax=Mesobacterium pallidum TaxID=2872037 RepID=UPI001EE2C67C|nr:endonuclease/exonuclease/phosphatase family protein [Mesobacterium pallidum]
MRVIAVIVVVLLGLALAGSYGGVLHPLGDSLAVFRLGIAGVFALWVIWTPWSAAIRWPLAGLGIAAMAGVLSWKLPGEATPGAVTVYQKNLYFGRQGDETLVADIIARGVEIVTLQEVTDGTASVLAALEDSHPGQHRCPFAGVGGPAIATSWPVVEGSRICPEPGGMAAMQVEAPDGTRVWVVSLHLHWPWPEGQAAQRDRLLPVMAALSGPIVLGGDFNMVPWSETFASIAEAVEGQRVRPVGPTLRARGVPLPIDHVLAPGGGTAELLPTLGSDHNGVLARVHLAP